MKFIKGSAVRYGETVVLGAGIDFTEDDNGLVQLIGSGEGVGMSGHEIADNTGLGSYHTTPALTTGMVLRVYGTSVNNVRFEALQASDIPNLSTTQITSDFPWIISEGGTNNTTFTENAALYVNGTGASQSIQSVGINATSTMYFLRQRDSLPPDFVQINYSWLTGTPSSMTPTAHALESAGGYHTASGLTTGHVLRATGANSFAFGAIEAGDLPSVLGITAEDVESGTYPQGDYTIRGRLLIDSGVGSIVYAGGTDRDNVTSLFVGSSLTGASGAKLGTYLYTKILTGGSSTPAGLGVVTTYYTSEAQTGTSYAGWFNWENQGTGNVTTVEVLNVGGGTGGGTGNITTLRGLKIGDAYELGGNVTTYYGLYISDLTYPETWYAIATQGGLVRFGDDSIVYGGGPQYHGVGMHYTTTHSGWRNAHTAVSEHTGTTQDGGLAAFEAWHSQNSSSGTQVRGQGLIAGVEQWGASTLNQAFAITAIVGTQNGGGTIDSGVGLWIPNTYVLNGGTINTLWGIKIEDLSGAGDNVAIETGKGKIRFNDDVDIYEGAFRVWDSGTTDYLQLRHNGTDAYVTTSVGDIYLEPQSNWVEVRGTQVRIIDPATSFANTAAEFVLAFNQSSPTEFVRIGRVAGSSTDIELTNDTSGGRLIINNAGTDDIIIDGIGIRPATNGERSLGYYFAPDGWVWHKLYTNYVTIDSGAMVINPWVPSETEGLVESLRVRGDAGGAPTFAADDVATFLHCGNSNQDAAIHIISGNTANADIRFGDTDAGARGIIRYTNNSPTADEMSFYVGTSLFWRMDPNGHLVPGDIDQDLGNATYPMRYVYRAMAVHDEEEYNTDDGTQNAWAPSTFVGTYLLDPSASDLTLNGINETNFPDGAEIRLINISGSYNVILTDESGSATANFRIRTGTGADITLDQYQSAILQYDGAQTSRWLVVGTGTGGSVGTITAEDVDSGTFGPGWYAFTGGQVIFPAATTSYGSIRIPHGSAPSSPINGDIWTTTTGLFARINGTTHQYMNLGGTQTITGTKTVSGVAMLFAAGATGYPSIRLPHGSAPTSPTNGDVWTTSSGMFVRVDGVSYNLLNAGIDITAEDVASGTYPVGGYTVQGTFTIQDKLTVGSVSTTGGATSGLIGDFQYTYSTSAWRTGLATITEHTGTTQTGGATAFSAVGIQNAGSGTQNQIQGAYIGAEQWGASTVSKAYALVVAVGTQDGGGTITEGRGLYIGNSYALDGGSIGTYYGMYIDSLTTAGTNYSMYTNTGLVHLGDSMEIDGSVNIKGSVLRTWDSGTADFVEIRHDGTDAHIWNDTGSLYINSVYATQLGDIYLGQHSAQKIYINGTSAWLTGQLALEIEGANSVILKTTNAGGVIELSPFGNSGLKVDDNTTNARVLVLGGNSIYAGPSGRLVVGSSGMSGNHLSIDESGMQAFSSTDTPQPMKLQNHGGHLLIGSGTALTEFYTQASTTNFNTATTFNVDASAISLDAQTTIQGNLVLSTNRLAATSGNLELNAAGGAYWSMEASTGTFYPSAGSGLGSDSKGIGSIYVTGGTKWYVSGNNYCNIGLLYSGNGVWESSGGFRIKLDSDNNSSTETFVVGHGSTLTEVFKVAENGQVNVTTGPLIVGTDPTGNEILRVGGGVRVDATLTNASGYDEGFVITANHTVASTGGPLGAGIYLDTEHTSGAVVGSYGLDVGLNHTGAGTVTSARVIEAWGGADTGAGTITNLYLFYGVSPYDVPGTSLTNAYGLYLETVSAGDTLNYAIYTNSGLVRFGDQVRVTNGSNNIYLNANSGSIFFEAGTDGSVDSTFIRAGNQGSPTTNNPAYYWSIRSDNSIMVYGYDGGTYRNLWEWNYATDSVKARATTFYVDGTIDFDVSGRTVTNQLIKRPRTSAINYDAFTASKGYADLNLIGYPPIDVLQFNEPISVEWWDSGTQSWQDWSPENLEELFDGKPSTYKDFTYLQYKFRFVTDIGTWRTAETMHIYQEYSTGGNKNYTIQMEYSGTGTDWVNMGTSDTITSYHGVFVADTATAGNQYVRTTLDFDILSGQVARICQVRLLGYRTIYGGHDRMWTHSWTPSSSIMKIGPQTAGGISSYLLYLGPSLSAPYLQEATTGGALRINSDNAYVDIGAQNSSWVHYYSSNSLPHIFNNGLAISGGKLFGYSTDLILGYGTSLAGMVTVATLNSTGLTLAKSIVEDVTDWGATATGKTIDSTSNKYTAWMTANFTFTVSIAEGQTAVLYVYAQSADRTMTWSGVDDWMTAEDNTVANGYTYCYKFEKVSGVTYGWVLSKDVATTAP